MRTEQEVQEYSLHNANDDLQHMMYGYINAKGLKCSIFFSSDIMNSFQDFVRWFENDDNSHPIYFENQNEEIINQFKTLKLIHMHLANKNKKCNNLESAPKFKKGDIVHTKYNNIHFVIKGITISANKKAWLYLIGDEWWGENKLELVPIQGITLAEMLKCAEKQKEMKIEDCRIGMMVHYKVGLHLDKWSTPMEIVGIFKDGTLYLDFEGNEGDVLEGNVSNCKPVNEE